jgi:hypothetical protein
MMLTRKVPLRKLPCRALQLIREYSKPITRGDWRTCSRIKMETYIKDKDKLDIINKNLYCLVHRNMYDELYRMDKRELYWLIFHQFEAIKYHTIVPLLDMTRLEMIYVEIQNQEIMKHPNYKQKNFFKNNQELMKLYTKNNKLMPNHRYKKYYTPRYFTSYN